MDAKTLTVLEYPKVLERLAANCDFSASKELARALEPTTSFDLAQTRLQETTEARNLLSIHDVSIGGAHDIRPSSDSTSSIAPANLVTTCGRCHPGIGERVSEGKVHVASVREDINLFAYGVQWFYYLLIAGIILFAASMIALDQYRHRVVDPRRPGGGHA